MSRSAHFLLNSFCIVYRIFTIYSYYCKELCLYVCYTVYVAAYTVYTRCTP